MEPLAVRHSQFNRVARQLNERSRETLGFETRAARVLMLVLHRPIEPTVISGHSVMPRRCPLYPPKADIGTQSDNVRFVPKADIVCCAHYPWRARLFADLFLLKPATLLP